MNNNIKDSLGFPKGRKATPVITLKNKYDSIIVKWANNYGIPWELVKAIIYWESSFVEDAVSRCGAKGLMQLMPSIYKPAKINPFNPKDNIRIGCKYLKRLWTIFKKEKGLERWKFALGSYNAGMYYIYASQRLTKSKGAKNYKWYHISTQLDRAKFRGKTADWKQVTEYVDRVTLKMVDYIIEHITGGNPCSSLEEYLEKCLKYP